MINDRFPFWLPTDQGPRVPQRVQMTTNDDDPTRIPPGLYAAITALASCSFEESWSLCQSLVGIIRNATENTPADARDSLLYSYTVKRLMRGLASTSEATRSNFASALFCIFTDIGALPFSKTVALVDAQLPLSAVASVRRSEQTAMLKGRLIAFNILFEFCSGDSGDLTIHLNRIQQEVIQLFLKHKGIERLAHHTLSKLHCRLPRSGVDPIRKDGEMSNKQRALALLYHKVDFKDEDAAWKLSTRASSLGGSLQAFYIYALSLLRSLMRANDPGAFESVWKSICRKVNKSEKRWLPLVRGLLIDLLPDDCVNDNFVAAILGSSSFVRALAARSEDFV